MNDISWLTMICGGLWNTLYISFLSTVRRCGCESDGRKGCRTAVSRKDLLFHF